MQHSMNEHEPQTLKRLDPRCLWGLIFLIFAGLGGGSLWYGQEQVPRAGGDRPLDQLGLAGTIRIFHRRYSSI